MSREASSSSGEENISSTSKVGLNKTTVKLQHTVATARTGTNNARQHCCCFRRQKVCQKSRFKAVTHRVMHALSDTIGSIVAAV